MLDDPAAARAKTPEYRNPPPPPAVTVTVKLEDKDREDETARHRARNHEHAERRQRLLDRLQEDVREPHDYSNNDLCNVINIRRDARTVIISKRQEYEEAEGYNQRQARKRPNIMAHNSEAGPSKPTPLPQQSKKASLTLECFERSLHKCCPWQPNNKHSAYECCNLGYVLGAPQLPPNPLHNPDDTFQG